MPTLPASRHRASRSRTTVRERSANAVTTLLSRSDHPWPTGPSGRHRANLPDARLGTVAVIVLSGWAATARLSLLLAGPLVAVATVAPPATATVAVPLSAGLLWGLRPSTAPHRAN